MNTFAATSELNSPTITTVTLFTILIMLAQGICASRVCINVRIYVYYIKQEITVALLKLRQDAATKEFSLVI